MIKVTNRANDGVDAARESTDTASAERLAKGLRTTANFMVCIEVDGQRVKRWDRSKDVGENRWRSVDVEAFETLGKLREVQRVKRSTSVTQDYPLIPVCLTEAGSSLLTFLVNSVQTPFDENAGFTVVSRNAARSVIGQADLTTTMNELLNVQTTLNGLNVRLLKTSFGEGADFVFGVHAEVVSHVRAHGGMTCPLFRKDFRPEQMPLMKYLSDL